MTIENSICEGCPAAFALGIDTDEFADRQGGFFAKIRQNEARKTRNALENAAGQTACRSISKQLPELPEAEAAAEVGTGELIDFVAECPSFLTYLQIR